MQCYLARCIRLDGRGVGYSEYARGVGSLYGEGDALGGGVYKLDMFRSLLALLEVAKGA